MTEKYLKALNKLLAETDMISGQSTLEGWKSTAENIVAMIYGNNSASVEHIKKLEFRPSYNGGSNALIRKHQAKIIIEGFIYQLIEFGLPERENKKPDSERIHISLTQNQHQEANINIDIILSAIKDELTGKQQKEVQEIIDLEAPVEEKKSRIIDKLKSFGSDVASNIVASILTNPQIFSS
ncbi:hypothetical protein [Pontibacter sp. HJ8]